MKYKNIRPALIEFAELLIETYDLPFLDVEESVNKFLEQREIKQHNSERAKQLAEQLYQKGLSINEFNDVEWASDNENIIRIIAEYFNSKVALWK